MLSFFRVNDPFRLFFVFLALVLIRVLQSYFIVELPTYGLKWLLLGEWLAQDFWLYAEAYDYTSPLSAGVYKCLHFIFGRSIFQYYVVSTLLIVVQAGIFNMILIKNTVYRENSYLPAFLYITTTGAIPDFMVLSPQLLSLTFVLLGLRSVARRVNNQIDDAYFIEAGIFIGIATLFYVPSFVFLLIYLVSLILFSSAIIRRILLYFFSFLMVWCLTYLFYHYYNIADLLFAYGVGGSMSFSSLSDWNALFLENGALFFVFLITVFVGFSKGSLTRFQLKMHRITLLMFVGSVVIFTIANDRSSFVMVYMIPVITYFEVYYFNTIRSRVFKIFAPIILIAGPIIYSCFVYTTALTLEVNFTVTRDGIMILGADLGYYKEQKMNTPCFDQDLTEVAFRGLDYYKSSARIYEIIEKNDPEGIYDASDVVDKLFYRFPSIKDKYRQVEPHLYIKN